MPDTQTDSRQIVSAIAYPGDAPQLELAGTELIYPITTADERFKLYCAVRPYLPFAVKKFYDQVIPKRRRRTAAETTVETPYPTDMREFVREHFLSFFGAVLESGEEPSVEMQRAWLDDNPAFLERIFREGFDRVGPRVRKTEPPQKKAILVFGRQDTRVDSEMRLYSRERKCEETLRVVHIIGRLTEADRHQIDSAISAIENARRGETYTSGNWDVIELKYNERIKSLDGALINGQACTPQNKTDWAKLVPFIMKFYVITQAFGEIELKNG